MKRALIRAHRILEQFGINPTRGFHAIAEIPAYLVGAWRFQRAAAKSTSVGFYPCLSDRHAEGGSTSSEYFWQDLLVARRIFERNSGIERHVDIGSRIDGFVAHVATFREIEVFDVRPVLSEVAGIRFRRLDLMSLPDELVGYCDSISCLHALEHFGLGRYGDPIDPRGHETGLSNLAAILKSGGTAYLSVPLGRERVEFNAHRVFHPRSILTLARSCGLQLQRFSYHSSTIARVADLTQEVEILALGEVDYCLGIFEFRKA